MICAALFYVIIILGGTSQDTQAMENATPPPPLKEMIQPTLSFLAADLEEAEAYFNAPVLKLSINSGWTLQGVMVIESQQQGISEMVREIRLHYINMTTGQMVNVSSITPSDVLRRLPDRGFVITGRQDYQIGGLKAAMMQNGDTLHLHAQRDGILYQIEGEISEETMQQTANTIVLVQ